MNATIKAFPWGRSCGYLIGIGLSFAPLLHILSRAKHPEAFWFALSAILHHRSESVYSGGVADRFILLCALSLCIGLPLWLSVSALHSHRLQKSILRLFMYVSLYVGQFLILLCYFVAWSLWTLLQLATSGG